MEIIKKVKKQQNKFLILPHPFTNFEIQKYYQNEPRFNGVYFDSFGVEHISKDIKAFFANKT